MKRVKFTRCLRNLLHRMIEDGTDPVVDYLLRSKHEQKRLYDAKLSKCDGVKKKSDHQYARAIDIYFVINGKIDFAYSTLEAKKYAKRYHNFWQAMGGKPMIKWDLPHYS